LAIRAGGFLNARQSELRPAAVLDAVLKEFYAKYSGKPVDDLTIVVLSHLGMASMNGRRGAFACASPTKGRSSILGAFSLPIFHWIGQTGAASVSRSKWAI
jgi:hypothetical protein